MHRDLKPANIKVRDDGIVKGLDFGLAKDVAPAGAFEGDAAHSPTLSNYATEAGVILGTAAYMAPVLAAVLTAEPPWNALPAETPTSIRRLSHRCLQRDGKAAI